MIMLKPAKNNEMNSETIGGHTNLTTMQISHMQISVQGRVAFSTTIALHCTRFTSDASQLFLCYSVYSEAEGMLVLPSP